MLVSAVGASVLAIVSGGFFRALTTKIGLWLTVATAWMLIGVPFSVWVGGSVTGLANTWLKSYIVFFLMAGLLTSLPQCRKMALSIALATGCIVLITYIFGRDTSDAGRLMGGGGTLGNSNDLATQLLIGLPFCVHVITDRNRSAPVRVFFVFVAAAALVIGMKTGSRGALLSVIVMAALIFWKASGGARIAVIATLVAGVISIPFVLTEDLKTRYLTVLGDNELAQSLAEDQRETASSAMLSTQARQEMIRNALDIFLHHPVFGVGFGQFQVAEAARASAAGEEASWHEVHNIFLVILAEDGLPALICFVLSFGYAYFVVFRIYNRSQRNEKDKEISRMALCLLASLTAYFVCSNFSPNAYGFQFPVLGGFAVAFDMIVTRYWSAQAAESTAAPALPGLSPIVKPRRNVPAWRP
jgi:O-antigen ligase